MSKSVLRIGLLAVAAVALFFAARWFLADGKPIFAGEPHLEDSFAVMPDGARLPLKVWAAKNPKAISVAVHGHNNYAVEFELFGPAPWLAERGITVYAYDQRGFGHAPDRGSWAGTDVMAHDLSTIAKLVAAAHPGIPLYILGQSMGGAVSILAMTSPDAPKVAGVILASPGVMGWETTPLWRRVIFTLTAWIRPDMLMPDSDAKTQTVSDNEALNKASAADPLHLHETRFSTVLGLMDLMGKAQKSAPDIKARTLYLYGARDETIPLKSVAPVVRKMRAQHVPLTLACYLHGWHAILNGLNRETVWQDILSWIDDPKAPLPSRAETRAGECGLGA